MKFENKAKEIASSKIYLTSNIIVVSSKYHIMKFDFT